MTPDIQKFLDFYNSPLGRITRPLLRKQIIDLAGDVRGKRVLGLGFATPFLRFALEDAERVAAVFPARMGAISWPINEKSNSVLCDPLEMPFSDASIDLIIATHAFEHSQDSEELMRELWRIAAPNAELIVIVPRRHGIWAQRDNNPFGFGHPFSRTQLDSLLRTHSFIPKTYREALYLPPSNSKILLKSARIFERGGSFFGATFASVICVKAKKQLFPAIPRRKKNKAKIRIPVLAPQTAMKLPKIY